MKKYLRTNTLYSRPWTCDHFDLLSINLDQRVKHLLRVKMHPCHFHKCDLIPNSFILGLNMKCIYILLWHLERLCYYTLNTERSGLFPEVNALTLFPSHFQQRREKWWVAAREYKMWDSLCQIHCLHSALFNWHGCYGRSRRIDPPISSLQW